MTIMPATPECDLMVSVSDDSHKIGEFLDWLEDQGIHLAEWDEDDQMMPHRESYERLLARFFGIDLDKVETERRALLEHIRAQS